MHRLTVVGFLLLAGTAAADSSVKLGTPKLKGRYDATALAAAVTKLSVEFTGCYQKTQPPVGSSNATVTFTIAGDGKVTSASATGLDKDAATCVAALFKAQALTKPKTGKAVTVTYPLTFSTVAVVVQGGSPAPSVGTGGGTIGGRTGTKASAGPAASIALGLPASVTGELDKTAIRTSIKRTIPKLAACYEKQLAITPALAGTLTAELTIGADGRVSAVTASGLGNKEVESCFASAIKALEFPKPKTGVVTVVYPLTLKPAGA